MNRLLRFFFISFAAMGFLVACKNDTPASAQSTPVAVNIPVADNLFADNYVLVFDDSGSMNSYNCGGGKLRINVAKDGALKFGNSLPADANLGLVVLNHQPVLDLVAGNRAEFEKWIKATGAGGGTPLVWSVKRARDMLLLQMQKQRGYGTYHIVVVTDGESGDGNPAPLVKEIVSKTPINVHVIGFCTDKSHSLYIPGFARFTNALNPETLEQGLKAVLAESESFVDSQSPFKN